MIEQVIGSWIDIIIVAVLAFVAVRYFKKKKAKSEEERRKKEMTPIEFSSWLEEQNKAEEKRKANEVKKKSEYANKLNNTASIKKDLCKLCLQQDGTIIVYNNFYYDKNEKETCISYNTYNISEGYHGYRSVKNFEISKINKDRERFLKLKDQLEFFGFTIKNLPKKNTETLKEK